MTRNNDPATKLDVPDVRSFRTYMEWETYDLWGDLKMLDKLYLVLCNVLVPPEHVYNFGPGINNMDAPGTTPGVDPVEHFCLIPGKVSALGGNGKIEGLFTQYPDKFQKNRVASPIYIGMVNNPPRLGDSFRNGPAPYDVCFSTEAILRRPKFGLWVGST